MSIVRLIRFMVDPSETQTVERMWKTEYTPLMISHGCIYEKLLRSRNRGGVISYSEWETEADIQRFMGSEAHKQIAERMRQIVGASATIELCDVVK